MMTVLEIEPLWTVEGSLEGSQCCMTHGDIFHSSCCLSVLFSFSLFFIRTYSCLTI